MPVIDLGDVVDLVMPRILWECATEKYMADYLMLPVPYLEDYFENKELFKKYFSFELTDHIRLDASYCSGQTVNAYNFIILMQCDDPTTNLGSRFIGKGFNTFSELNEYIMRYTQEDFKFWLYIKDIEEYKEVQYKVSMTEDGKFCNLSVPCMAIFSRVPAPVSTGPMPDAEKEEFESKVFRSDYHVGMFQSLEQVKQYIDETKVIPVIQLGYICYFKSSFEYDGVKYDLC